MTKQLDFAGMPAGDVDAHLWAKDPREHYVEETWCDTRLFDEEPFTGSIIDPCCGWGRIPQAAIAAGYNAFGSDIVNRGYADRVANLDFLKFDATNHAKVDNIVMNPPFTKGRAFVEKALTITTGKVASIFPIRRMPAMGKWIAKTPLLRVWLMTPRPSMPPGSYIKAGGKIGGGTVDFAWLVFMAGYEGKPTIEWLHRDGAPT